MEQTEKKALKPHVKDSCIEFHHFLFVSGGDSEDMITEEQQQVLQHHFGTSQLAVRVKTSPSVQGENNGNHPWERWWGVISREISGERRPCLSVMKTWRRALDSGKSH